MTPIEAAVIALLKSLGPVTALAGQRIWQLKLPQAPTLPSVRVQLIDDVPSYHARGENNLLPSRVQIDAFVEELSNVDAYARVTALAAAISGDWQDGSPGPPTGLSGWRGDLAVGSPPTTIRVNFIRRIDRGVSYEGAERKQVRVRQDFMVWWKYM